MVLYDRVVQASQLAQPIDPTCGGNRTSGEPSTVDILDELSVTEQIVDLLAQLPDDAARRHVLAWAGEVLTEKDATPVASKVARVSTQPLPVAPVPNPSENDPDGDLVLGDLDDLFGDRGAPQEAAPSHVEEFDDLFDASTSLIDGPASQAGADEPVGAITHNLFPDLHTLAADSREH